MVRVDPDYNIWTTDIGSHVVLKLSPEGRVTARRWGEYGFREDCVPPFTELLRRSM